MKTEGEYGSYKAEAKKEGKGKRQSVPLFFFCHRLSEKHQIPPLTCYVVVFLEACGSAFFPFTTASLILFNRCGSAGEAMQSFADDIQDVYLD